MPYPDESNLTTVATLKTWIGMDSSDASADSALGALITRCSKFLCRLIHRDFIFSKAITEKYDGMGGDRLFLRGRPITAVSAVSIGTLTIPLSNGQTAGYLFDGTTIYLIGYRFDRGKQNVSISYTCGISAGDADQLILEQGALEMCTQKWSKRQHADQTSIAMGGGAGTVSFSQRDVPSEVKLVIQELQDRVPVR